MKKLYFFLPIFILVLHACTKEKEQLDLANEPDSVRQHITENCTCDPRVGLFKWDDRVLYVHWYIGPACNTFFSFYNEDGSQLDLSAEEQQAFWEHKELVKMIWVCGE